jgi:hypothetical protein
MRGAKLPAERFFVHPARDGNGPEAHLRGELNAQVAETANAENSDKIARACAAVPQRV